jgi:four helix bundle protein
MGSIRPHRDLDVYQRAFSVAMEIYEVTRGFPDHERFGLTSQIRRSSRSVCNNLCEAWRKRRYEAAFVAKLSDAETEAAETQSHIEFCVACKYVFAEEARQWHTSYDGIIRTHVGMINNPDTWTIRKKA